MNKKGNIGISIIVAIMIFMVGTVTVNILKPEIDNARAADALDCSNISISDGTKLTCLAVDATVPYFIVVVLAAAGGMITARLT